METDRIRLKFHLIVFVALLFVGSSGVDRHHLEGDIMRAYRLLVFDWVADMRYLRNNYGYLLSLAMRVSPFDPEASAVVRQP